MSGRTRANPRRAFKLDFTPLRRARGYALMGPSQLARASGVDRSTLYRLEYNLTQNPSIVHVIALGRALGRPWHELLEITDLPDQST